MNPPTGARAAPAPVGARAKVVANPGESVLEAAPTAVIFPTQAKLRPRRGLASALPRAWDTRDRDLDLHGRQTALPG